MKTATTNAIIEAAIKTATPKDRNGERPLRGNHPITRKSIAATTSSLGLAELSDLAWEKAKNLHGLTGAAL